MPKSRKNFGSNFKALDAHVITPEEYEEAPEWTDAQIAAADVHEGGKLIRRGRPPSPETRKQPVKIRLDPDLVASLRASGPGWQTRLNALLRKAVLGAKGVRISLLARELKSELRGVQKMRATAKRRKDEARQRLKKAHLKKARA
jgi:uncharacterized protein (DUF4415 family)